MTAAQEGPRAAADFRNSFARSLGSVMQFDAGAAIFSEGDAAEHMYVLLSGSVEMVAHDRQIERIGAGQAFGFLALIDRQPRNVTARALEACEVARLDARRFRFMVEETPNFVWFILGELADRLRVTMAAVH